MFRKSERGFGVIAAIVILVILAVLGTFIVTLSTTQQRGEALDVDGARAYAAALSGSEWGLAKAINAKSCTAFGSVSLGQINGMYVTVTSATLATGNSVEAGLGSICQITAVACNQPTTGPLGGACPGNATSPTYVERQIVAIPEF